MRRWLSSITSKNKEIDEPGKSSSSIEQIELLVIEGDDIGQRFTVDGEEMVIGRRLPEESTNKSISLRDNTVSSRQALIKRKRDGYYLQHLETATNLTLLDGDTAVDLPLSIGCRIEIGRVIMVVKDRNIDSNRRSTVRVEKAASGPATEDVSMTNRDVSATDKTLTRLGSSQPVGRLIVIKGESIVGVPEIAVEARPMMIGRGEQSDIQIMDGDVSRAHAQLVTEGSSVLLIHRSTTNSTYVNDKVIVDRTLLNDGDVIALTDNIALQFRSELEADTADAGSDEPEMRPVSGNRAGDATANDKLRKNSLQDVMEEKVRIDQTIEEEYTVDGSFLDVDVVDSYGMKVGDISPEHTIISFERFRNFVGATVVEYDGQVLNSNGDELMCFFGSPLDAVKAANQMLLRLDSFNRDRNMLSVPFKIRIGVHTGKSLVDLDRGVAYSPVLDVAGHLQKAAETNSLVVSQSTLDALPSGLPFKHGGKLKRGVTYFALTEALE